MKPLTKKILIIAAAVAVVGVILYFTLRGSKKTAKGMINRLDVSSDIKKAIISHLDEVKALPEETIKERMAVNNCNYEQALALSAAYYLVDDQTVDDATWQRWKAEILAM